jgi:hypothetical protein
LSTFVNFRSYEHDSPPLNVLPLPLRSNWSLAMTQARPPAAPSDAPSTAEPSPIASSPGLDLSVLGEEDPGAALDLVNPRPQIKPDQQGSPTASPESDQPKR